MKCAFSSGKITTREEAGRRIVDWKKSGLSTGFTSGVFDLLHAGHVAYLEEAAQSCDRLVVAVNSDSSVRKIKGEKRPICEEAGRLSVLSALSCVDLVFPFSEPNNNLNVELLKPDIYVKAGDYSTDRLTSASIVERYGGSVLIVPFKGGYSTTQIIERVLDAYSDQIAKEGPEVVYEKAPAVFLDRDGTINEETNYVSDPHALELIPGVVDSLKALNEAGFRIVVVTNQPGIGFGYYSRQDFFRVNSKLLKAAGKAGALIHRIYYCPHTMADECLCRKPNDYFLRLAEKDLNVDLSRSFVVGDRTGDVEFGKRAGLRTVLVRTGVAGKDGQYEAVPDFEAVDLAEAVSIIVQASKS